MFRTMIAGLCSLMLAACATVGMNASTPEQKLYAAHASYNIVLERAVTYAESDYADGGVVSALNEVNKQIAPNIKYAHAFVACTSPDGDPALILAARIKCGDFDFNAASILTNTELISSAAERLLSILKSKGIVWATPPSYSFASQTSQYSSLPKAQPRSSSTANYVARSARLSSRTASLRTPSSTNFSAKPRAFLPG